VTLQLTGTVVPVATEAKAVQDRAFLEETMDAGFPEESLQMTAVIAVAPTIVRLAVAVRVDCTWEVAVIVTLLLMLGTVAGAVYSPPLVIDPVPVPLTDQFTRVLLALRTVAVHCAVPRTVTSAPVPCVGTHEAVMDGVTAVLALLPQELRIAGKAIRAKKKKIPSQRTLPGPKWKFGSSTRNPPARATLIFLIRFFRWSARRTPRSECALPMAVEKCLTVADECPAPETMFSHCRRNPTFAHLQPSCWQAV